MHRFAKSRTRFSHQGIKTICRLLPSGDWHLLCVFVGACVCVWAYMRGRALHWDAVCSIGCFSTRTSSSFCGRRLLQQEHKPVLHSYGCACALAYWVMSGMRTHTWSEGKFRKWSSHRNLSATISVSCARAPFALHSPWSSAAVAMAKRAGGGGAGASCDGVSHQIYAAYICTEEVRGCRKVTWKRFYLFYFWWFLRVMSLPTTSSPFSILHALPSLGI